ncbi:MAG: phosphatase 2C-like domain-containing protein, partial [Olpidium bornovanus]
MEDAHTTILRLKGQERVSFFAVFDGHGGESKSRTRSSGPFPRLPIWRNPESLADDLEIETKGASAAKFAGKALHKRLESEPAFKESNYVAALKNTFLGTDADLKNDPELKHDPSGCTAVAVLVTDDKIYCVRFAVCVLGRFGRRSLLRCRAHRDHFFPEQRRRFPGSDTANKLPGSNRPRPWYGRFPAETQRIVNAGGFVEFGRVNGNLALSRALGDFEFKKNANLPPEKQIVTGLFVCCEPGRRGCRPAGLPARVCAVQHPPTVALNPRNPSCFESPADPDIAEHILTPEDEFVVIACDGRPWGSLKVARKFAVNENAAKNSSSPAARRHMGLH